MAQLTKRHRAFVDLELALQGAKLDPTLQAICDLIDQGREVPERVHADLDRALKNPGKGHHDLTARQVGALIPRPIKNWDYRELREPIADALRQFTEFPRRQGAHA
jgi:hypothetical protein